MMSRMIAAGICTDIREAGSRLVLCSSFQASDCILLPLRTVQLNAEDFKSSISREENHKAPGRTDG